MIVDILNTLPWLFVGCFLAIAPAAYLQDYLWMKKDQKDQTN